MGRRVVNETSRIPLTRDLPFSLFLFLFSFSSQDSHFLSFFYFSFLSRAFHPLEFISEIPLFTSSWLGTESNVEFSIVRSSWEKIDRFRPADFFFLRNSYFVLLPRKNDIFGFKAVIFLKWKMQSSNGEIIRHASGFFQLRRSTEKHRYIILITRKRQSSCSIDRGSRWEQKCLVAQKLTSDFEPFFLALETRTDITNENRSGLWIEKSDNCYRKWSCHTSQRFYF